jgi:hypothetical protein
VHITITLQLLYFQETKKSCHCSKDFSKATDPVLFSIDSNKKRSRKNISDSELKIQ